MKMFLVTWVRRVGCVFPDSHQRQVMVRMVYARTKQEAIAMLGPLYSDRDAEAFRVEDMMVDPTVLLDFEEK
jgi:hypothetical protein